MKKKETKKEHKKGITYSKTPMHAHIHRVTYTHIHTYIHTHIVKFWNTSNEAGVPENYW